MPLDDQARAFLEQLAATRGPAPLTLEQMRANAGRSTAALGPVEEVAAVEDREIPGPNGPVPVRLYRPAGDPPLPGLVYFHGGGWRMGNLDGVDRICRALARRAGCLVVSVDYRLAPENKFPIGLEDCYAATRWLAEAAPALGVDRQRLAVAGDSAGGNLAAVVCLLARERGGPPLIFQALLYPPTGPDVTTASWKENSGYMMTLESGAEMIAHYIRNDEDRRNPHFAPLLAEDLSGLPPALIVTAEYDPLRDEGEAYAERLRAAGVPTELRRYDGTIHAFIQFAGVLDKGKQGLEDVAAALRAAFAKA